MMFRRNKPNEAFIAIWRNEEGGGKVGEYLTWLGDRWDEYVLAYPSDYVADLAAQTGAADRVDFLDWLRAR